ncbi:PREDICTED: uncharacterized protein LOC109243414 [Nicotiana attenuata]|uniref:uncharacterized protein LOC109243414 n=1 Tax=Nicotiana attenuata TaxID=49451 RepID=UPI0009048230|nr:PREDICTED: uncharacterized protein LOC109243414 [Nicotiana attenuata]
MGNTDETSNVTAIDSSSPMFLHPSDIPGIFLVHTPFSGTGFSGWKRSIIVSFSTKNKISFIDGTCPKPAENSPHIKQWNRCNNMVISWLTSSLSPEIAESVQYSETAESIWEQLYKRYVAVNGTKKPGHLIDKCYKLQGFPPNFKFTKGKRIAANVTTECEFSNDSNPNSSGHTPNANNGVIVASEGQKSAGHFLKKPLELGRVDDGLYKSELPLTSLPHNSVVENFTSCTLYSDVSPTSVNTSISTCNKAAQDNMDIVWHQRLALVPFVRMQTISVISISSKQYFPCNSVVMNPPPDTTTPVPSQPPPHVISTVDVPVNSSSPSSPVNSSSPVSPSITTNIPSSDSQATTSAPLHSPPNSPAVSNPVSSIQPPAFNPDILPVPPTESEPYTYAQAAHIPAWQEAMRKEFEALDANKTWDIVELPAGKKPIGCKWVYKIKYRADGSVERYKARLVIRVVAIKQGWSMFQLDVNNAFLHGDLHEEVYMKLPQGSSGNIVILVVYVDDIILTGNNLVEISALKDFLDNEFKIKDLGLLHYFLGIEVNASPSGVFLNQRKFDSKLKADSGELFDHPKRYRSLIGKLLFLTHTRPDLSFGVQYLSQFLQAPRLPHMTVALHMLRYLKGTFDVGLFYSNSPDCTLIAYSDSDWAACPNTRKSVSSFCVFLGDCLVSWKSKKQLIVSLSSAEAKYKALSKLVAELTWLTRLLPDLSVPISYPVYVFCDNQAAIHIAKNPVFHERTKHIEVDFHFIQKKLADGLIQLFHVTTSNQLADIFTKPLTGVLHQSFQVEVVLPPPT